MEPETTESDPDRDQHPVHRLRRRILVLDALSRIGTFRGCDARQLGLVADAVVGRISVEAGQTLCREGETGNAWWVVLAGTASAEVAGTKVGTVAADTAVGELSIFDGRPRSATVTAIDELDVLEFSGDALVAAIRHEPQIGINLLSMAAGRLRATNTLVG